MRKFLSLATFLLLSIALFSQDTNPVAVAQNDYFKVKDQDIPAFLANEKEWKKVHEERVKTGKIFAWYLFEVLLPSGSQVDHNYVTVTLYRSYADIETLIPDIMAAWGKAFPDQNAQGKMVKANALRERVKTDFNYNEHGYWKTGTKGIPEFKYINASMVKVDEGKEAAYEEQFKYWEKILNARTDMGMDVGWQTGTLIRSHGTADPYSYYTFQFYSDFKQSEFKMDSWYKAAMKAYPNGTPKDMGDKYADLLKIRSVYRDELWRVVDFAK